MQGNTQFMFVLRIVDTHTHTRLHCLGWHNSEFLSAKGGGTCSYHWAVLVSCSVATYLAGRHRSAHGQQHEGYHDAECLSRATVAFIHAA